MFRSFFCVLALLCPPLRWRVLPWRGTYLAERPLRRWAVCRVRAAGVNPVDAKFLYGDKLPHFMLPLVKAIVERRICGIDFSGEVVEVGLGSRFKVGDAVFGTMPPFVGSFAPFVRAPEDQLCLKPANLSFAQVVFI